MKNIIFLLCILFGCICGYAQQAVGEYQNSYFKKEFKIEAFEKNGKLETVYVGIDAKDAKSAFISVDGKDLELFKNAVETVRDKYLDWVRIAKENNVTEMNKEFDIKFPSVTIAWLGTKWWFSFGQKPKLRFLILDNGKCVASWAPKVTSSSNRYIDQQIYFVFADEDDFNNLIDQLDYQTILSKLLNSKSKEDLFQ